MKKLTMIAAVLAAMTLGAYAADVYSSNVVGYQKLTINPGYNLIAPSFLNLGDNSAQAMNDLFPEAQEKATAGAGDDVSDNILIWTGGTYVNYYFYYTGLYGEEYDYKWYDALDDADPTEAVIDTKDGFWYRSRAVSPYTMLVQGQVSTNASETITINPGYNLIANPYPVALPLNGAIDWDAAGSVSGAGDDVSDNILAWVGGTYVNYYFYYTGLYGEEYDYKWYDALDDADPTEYEIPVGSGVWYRYRGTEPITLTINNPLNN